MTASRYEVANTGDYHSILYEETKQHGFRTGEATSNLMRGPTTRPFAVYDANGFAALEGHKPIAQQVCMAYTRTILVEHLTYSRYERCR